jgi:hypothetical protein
MPPPPPSLTRCAFGKSRKRIRTLSGVIAVMRVGGELRTGVDTFALLKQEATPEISNSPLHPGLPPGDSNPRKSYLTFAWPSLLAEVTGLAPAREFRTPKARGHHSMRGPWFINPIFDSGLNITAN